ncbi:MAG: hypothetical protein R3C45_03100 [Phycisphaerales bacterium]
MWKTLTTRYFNPPIGSSPIVMGFGMSLIGLIGPGIVFLLIGRSFSYNRWHAINNEPSWTMIEGRPGVLCALFYIFMGLSFHFSYYWSEKPALEKYSPILSNCSVLIGIAFLVWSVLA